MANKEAHWWLLRDIAIERVRCETDRDKIDAAQKVAAHATQMLRDRHGVNFNLAVHEALAEFAQLFDAEMNRIKRFNDSVEKHLSEVAQKGEPLPPGKI